MSSRAVYAAWVLWLCAEGRRWTRSTASFIRFKSPLTPRLSGDKVNDNRNDRPNDSRIDRLSESVKKTYQIIRDNPGIQRKRISELADKSIPTIDRHLAILVKEYVIEHRDSDKTGGYYAK